MIPNDGDTALNVAALFGRLVLLLRGSKAVHQIGKN